MNSPYEPKGLSRADAEGGVLKNISRIQKKLTEEHKRERAMDGCSVNMSNQYLYDEIQKLKKDVAELKEKQK